MMTLTAYNIIFFLDEVPEDTSGSGLLVMIILAVVGTVGIVAVAALIVVLTFSVRKQQQVQNRR